MIKAPASPTCLAEVSTEVEALARAKAGRLKVMRPLILIMIMFSKFKDVQAVIDRASSLLANIEKQYLQCLSEEKIPESLLVDIKDYLGNLRTSLDFLWNKIPNVTSGYFPVANSEAEFRAKTKNIDKRYVTLFEKFQDYDSNSWIRCFNLFRNKNIHVTLVPQERKETKEFSVKKTGAKEIMATFSGCYFGGNGNHISVNGIPMPIDLKTQFPRETQGLDIKRKIWVDFLFDGSLISSNFPKGISALPFLKESLKKVQDIISEFEKELK